MVDNSIIHCNLNPDNIIISLDQDPPGICDLKILNFGKSISYNEHQCGVTSKKIAGGDVEYLPPEILKYLDGLQRCSDPEHE